MNTISLTVGLLKKAILHNHYYFTININYIGLKQLAESKSKAGAPTGNNNAGKNAPWRDAINAAMLKHKEYGGSVERATTLREIAAKLIDMALEGDLGAMKELGDRVEGKAKQTLDITNLTPESMTTDQLQEQLKELDNVDADS